MKRSLVILFAVFILGVTVQASVTLCSWNLMNLGNSKSDKTLDFIAATLQPFDVIAIQEVISGNGGAQTVALLVDIMNRKGKSWDYSVSNSTSTTGKRSERYAFIWNKSIVSKKGDAWLEMKYSNEIEREPYMATFQKEGKLFTVASFHAITKSDNPETEIKYFKSLPAHYPSLYLIFCGDFNCPQWNNVFNPLKSMGYLPALKNQRTTLRDKCLRDGCLASEFDNLFYDRNKFRRIDAGVVHFYKRFSSMREARMVSDHVPVWLEFEIR